MLACRQGQLCGVPLLLIGNALYINALQNLLFYIPKQ